MTGVPYIHTVQLICISKRPDEAPDPRRVNVVSHIPCSSTACLFISDFDLCTCGSRSQFLLILTSYALRLLSLPTVHTVPINPCSLQFAFQFRGIFLQLQPPVHTRPVSGSLQIMAWNVSNALDPGSRLSVVLDF